MMPGLFIQSLADNPIYFGCVVFTVIFSITVHELAHGYAAMYFGDRTPRLTGHLTIDPLVHMGPWSFLMLALFGIAWGQMPIDPTRLKGRYSEAMVAAAGPVSNLLLGFIALSAAGIWLGLDYQSMQSDPLKNNILYFLRIFGHTNWMLCLFNLFPIPPLDGSHIFANFNRKYALFISDPAHYNLLRLLFAFTFAFSGPLVIWGERWGHSYMVWVLGWFS